MAATVGVPAAATTAPVSGRQHPAASGPLPPLQNRTPEQLRDGLVVKVTGAGSDDLAVARLIQDGAKFVAETAGTTMGLANVRINDGNMDMAGALGMATFQGLKGWFGLSQRSTRNLMEGIARLREKPFEQWTEFERNAFVQGNATVLHEAGHVTLPAYDSANVGAWHNANRAFEEGLTELTTMGQIADFMKKEYAVEVPLQTMRIQQSVSAYTRYTERIQRMLSMGGDGSDSDAFEAARRIGDNVRADQRLKEIAQRISHNLGGPDAPELITQEIAKTLPRFVAEENGTRTRLMELQSALADHKAGKPFDEAALKARLARFDREHPPRRGVVHEVNGTEPIERPASGATGS